MSRTNLVAGFTLTCALVAAATLVARAGPLDPPAGPISSTSKTLAEVEPRMAVNAANTPGGATDLFIISQPGSYYLTGNISGVSGKSGIRITTNNVSLDLNGFAMVGAAGSLDAIASTGASNVIIRNGNIVGWGGLAVDLPSGFGAKISDLVIQLCNGGGINVQFDALITNCTMDTGGIGINVSCCTNVIGCHVQAGTIGIQASQGVNILDCMVNNCGSHGISLTSSGNRVERCGSSFNNGEQIRVASESTVVGNTLHVLGTASTIVLHVTGTGSLIDSNNCFDGSVSILVDAGGNTITRNSVRNATTPFSIVAGNTVGPTVTSANIATAVSPFANISY